MCSTLEFRLIKQQEEEKNSSSAQADKMLRNIIGTMCAAYTFICIRHIFFSDTNWSPAQTKVYAICIGLTTEPINCSASIRSVKYYAV